MVSDQDLIGLYETLQYKCNCGEWGMIRRDCKLCAEIDGIVESVESRIRATGEL